MLFEEFDDVFPATFPKAAYEAFAARPWWHRVWVVQELALNSNEPIFAVGDRRVRYGLLNNFTNFLLLLNSAAVRMTRYMRNVQESIVAQQVQTGEEVGEITEAEVVGKERFDAIQAICAMTAVDVMIGFRSRYNRLKDEQPHTLLSILKHMVIRLSGERGKMALLATDERDRVYALLGLADVVLNIPIRYDRDWTAADVYRAMTRELLVNGDLEVLSVTRDPLAQKAKGLPSWICSWSATTCDLPFGDGTHIDRPFKSRWALQARRRDRVRTRARYRLHQWHPSRHRHRSDHVHRARHRAACAAARPTDGRLHARVYVHRRDAEPVCAGYDAIAYERDRRRTATGRQLRASLPARRGRRHAFTTIHITVNTNATIDQPLYTFPPLRL